MRFDHYLSDVKDWITALNQIDRFTEIIVIGHSEGSLLGMIASQDTNVDAFISIAGAGQSADGVLKEQLKSQPAEVLELSLPIIDRLVQGETVNNVNPMVDSLFRPSAQPFLISWFKYDPAREIAKLNIPVLIIQGTRDIQMSENDANRLAAANQKAEKKIIKGMNYIFKEADSNRTKNIQTYSQPELPIKPELVESIVGFIDKNQNQY